MRKLTILLLTLLLCSSLFAQGLYTDISYGPKTTLKIFSIDNGTKSEIDPEIYSQFGGTFDIAVGCNLTSWFGVGLATGFSYNGNDIHDNAGTFTVPVKAEVLIEPGIGMVSLPLRIGLGGYAQLSGNRLALGPVASASLGINFIITESFSFGYAASADVLMQFADGFKRATYQVNLVPVATVFNLSF